MKTNHKQDDDGTDQEGHGAMDRPSTDSAASTRIPWKNEQFRLIARIENALQDEELESQISQGRRELLRSDLGDLSDVEAVLPSDLIDAWLGTYSDMCRCAKQLYEEHPELWGNPEEDVLPDLPPLTQAAYDAAVAEWPKLLAKYPGQYVLYHGSEQLDVKPDANKLLNTYADKGYSDGEVMLFHIEPEPPSPGIED